MADSMARASVGNGRQSLTEQRCEQRVADSAANPKPMTKNARERRDSEQKTEVNGK